MTQAAINNNQEEWIKVLAKGSVTLPKKWREELGIITGDMIKIKKEGKRVIIETQQEKHSKIKTFDFKPMTEVEASLRDADYPEREIDDMIESLSELPQYANRNKGIKKSK